MAFRTDAPAINADEIKWDEIGETDPKTRLLAHVRLAGVDMHLEARQVDPESEDETTIDHPEDHDRLCDIDDNGRHQLMERDGREYFLFALPYGG